MQLINIMPVANLEDTKYQPMQMFLTHLVLSNETYRQFAKEYTGFKILDNSIIELGEAASIEKVLEAAEMIEADEIILPDVFQNCDETLKAVSMSLKYLRENNLIGKYGLMAVAQGRTPEDWERCFSVLDEMSEIHTIGIPKILAKIRPGGRPSFEHYWVNSKKDIHLLGLYYTFSELFDYKNPGKIRSCDTCQFAFLIKNRLGCYSVRPDGFTVDLEKDFFTIDTYYQQVMEYLSGTLR